MCKERERESTTPVTSGIPSFLVVFVGEIGFDLKRFRVGLMCGGLLKKNWIPSLRIDSIGFLH